MARCATVPTAGRQGVRRNRFAPQVSVRTAASDDMVLHGHRDSSLLAQIMLFTAQENPPAFLERVRNRLAQRITDGESRDETCPLQLLAAWYDPANWRVTENPNGMQIEFVRPLHLEASADETLKMQRDQDILFLPTRARRLIDEGKPSGDDEMEKLWVRFDEFADSWRGQEGEKRVTDAVVGIAATAIVLRPDWLMRVDGRYGTAVDLIDSVAASPPEAPGFDSPDQIYDQGWDAFHSDVAGTLYARDPGDRTCRERVIVAATGYHYIVVGRLLRAFTRARPTHGGPPLGPLINLIIQWAALREACRLDGEFRGRLAGTASNCGVLP